MRRGRPLCFAVSVTHLAMCLTGIPSRMRVAALTEADVPALTRLVADMESAYFGRFEANEPEVLGVLRSPELHGTRGTAAVWEDDELLAALLAHDGLEHGRGLHLDLFLQPGAAGREPLAHNLLAATERYGQALAVPGPDWMKSENFAGDQELFEVFRDRGYEQHRVYLRMRIDLTGPPLSPGDPPAGLTARTMTDQDWPDLYRVVTSAFADHYDFHPLPFEAFRTDMLNGTSDRARMRLVFDGEQCVAACIASKRFAPHKVGYVETLAVLRQCRGRGVARFLLHDAFDRDRQAGFEATTLHCDATNPTGAAHLYESVGMCRDQEYLAWRTPLAARAVAPSQAG